jgi:hypothetical protein
MNPTLNVFMPALVQQQFISSLPLNAATLPIIQTSVATQLFQQHQQQVAAKQEQTPPAASFFHHSFFNTPTTSNLASINNTTATLSLNNPASLIAPHHQQNLAHTFRPTLPETSVQQQVSFAVVLWAFFGTPGFVDRNPHTLFATTAAFFDLFGCRHAMPFHTFPSRSPRRIQI